MHCSLNINTETGRLSARRPNLQNQPALEKDRYKVWTVWEGVGGCAYNAKRTEFDVALHFCCTSFPFPSCPPVSAALVRKAFTADRSKNKTLSLVPVLLPSPPALSFLPCPLFPAAYLLLLLLRCARRSLLTALRTTRSSLLTTANWSCASWHTWPTARCEGKVWG